MALQTTAARRVFAAFSSAVLACALAPGLALADSSTAPEKQETLQVLPPSETDKLVVADAPSTVDFVAETVEAALAQLKEDGYITNDDADLNDGANSEEVEDANIASGSEGARDGENEAANADDSNAADDSAASQPNVPAEEESPVAEAADEPIESANDSGFVPTSENDDNANVDAEADAESASSTSAAESASAAASQSVTQTGKSVASEQKPTSSASPSVSTQAEDASIPPSAGNHTVSWANSSEDAKSWSNDEQAYVHNGQADVVQVKLADSGETLSKAELAGKSTSDPAYFLNGVLCAPTGSKVTIQLLPGRGYQLKSNKIGGGKVTLKASDNDDKIGVYTFDMPEEGFALDCNFESVKDDAYIDTKAVTAATISGAESTVKNGTLELSVMDIDDRDEEKALVSGGKIASADSVVAYLDIMLSNMVYMGSEDETWETVLESISSPITVTLTLSDSIAKSATSFYVVREHDGEYQQASVAFDASSKTISFKTDKFSYYALVKGAPPANATSTPSSTPNNTSTSTSPTSSTTTNTGSTTSSSTTSGSTTPKTGDTDRVTPLVIGIALSAGIAAYALRRLRRLHS